MKKLYKFYASCFVFISIFFFGFVYFINVNRPVGLTLFCLFCISVVFLEFSNFQISIISKTYELYLKGRIDGINLSKFQLFIERMSLKDLRCEVEDKRRESSEKK